MAKKTILITGAAGFIGSCLVKHLNELGFYDLILVDNLGKSEKWQNLVGKKFTDLLPKEGLFDWLKGKEGTIKALFHLGACSSTTEGDASYLLENNYRYSVRLAETLLPHDVRFIYASSAATYGDGSLGFSDDHSLLESYRPLNMYGYSKHLFDLWLYRKGLLDKVAGLKYFNVYGPNEYHKGRMMSALLKMVPEVRQGAGVRLFKSSEPEKFGDGEQVRDFIYVKDVVKMTAALLTNNATGIFNVGTGKPETWNKLATSVFAALGAKPQIHYTEMPQDLIGKYQNYTCARMAKWEKEGLPLASYNLKDAALDYVQNYIVPMKYW